MDRTLTTREAAALLGRSHRTIYRLPIPYLQVGRTRVYLESDVLAHQSGLPLPVDRPRYSRERLREMSQAKGGYRVQRRSDLKKGIPERARG